MTHKLPRANVAKVSTLSAIEPTADALVSIIKGKSAKMSSDDVMRNFDALKEQNAKLTKLSTALSLGKIPVADKKPVLDIKGDVPKLPGQQTFRKATVGGKPTLVLSTPEKAEKADEKVVIRKDMSLDEIKLVLRTVKCPKLNKHSISHFKDKDKMLKALADADCHLLSIE
jgi:hypothetical protein